MKEKKLKHPQVRLYEKDYQFIKWLAKSRVTPIAQIIHEWRLTLSYQAKIPMEITPEISSK